LQEYLEKYTKSSADRVGNGILRDCVSRSVCPCGSVVETVFTKD
jgi:hypothetical protein